MGNKYYDGVIFRIPQLTMPGTYMGERCTAKGTGIALNPGSSDYADSIWEWFKSLDRIQFEKNCDADLDAILLEYNSGKELLNGLFNAERLSDNACQTSH